MQSEMQYKLFIKQVIGIKHLKNYKKNYCLQKLFAMLYTIQQVKVVNHMLTNRTSGLTITYNRNTEL